MCLTANEIYEVAMVHVTGNWKVLDYVVRRQGSRPCSTCCSQRIRRL